MTRDAGTCDLLHRPAAVGHASGAALTASHIVELWPDGAPGSETWTREERAARSTFDGHLNVRNVTVPTLTAFTPGAPGGTAAIICPGGGFRFLTMDNEGTAVAERLIARGVTAYVLKYRVVETPAEDDEYIEQMRALFATPSADRARSFAEATAAILPLAVADAQQAIRLVRREVAAPGVAPDRIGLLGFSAGASVAVAAALDDGADVRPAFVAAVYPPALGEDVDVPGSAPPLFVAVAGDDEIVGVEGSMHLFETWCAAGKQAELHVFSGGGHGFGMRRQGQTSDHWLELFDRWLELVS